MKKEHMLIIADAAENYPAGFGRYFAAIESDDMKFSDKVAEAIFSRAVLLEDCWPVIHHAVAVSDQLNADNIEVSNNKVSSIYDKLIGKQTYSNQYYIDLDKDPKAVAKVFRDAALKQLDTLQ